MFYTIYLTTNNINGKIYIGKHKTSNINDSYFGSGKALRNAIKLYGINNFTKTVLFVFDNEDDMNSKEKELVTEDFCKRKDTYNLCVGGKGGFSYIHNSCWEITNEKIQKKRRETVSKEEYKEKISGCIKNSEKFKNGISKRGKTCFFHSEETKEKMRKPKNVKDKNPQYGTMWVTNGLESRQIKKELPIPEGWRKGRTINK